MTFSNFYRRGAENAEKMPSLNSSPNLGAEYTQRIIQAAIEVHKHFGPGLLESVYEESLAIELKNIGLAYERQKALPLTYRGVKIDALFRLDFIVENTVILELKAIEKILPIHEAQLLSYMKLSKIELGLLLNFNTAMMKEGIKQLAFSQPKLRIDDY